MIFPLCKWYFDINWRKFEKRWADVFQIYPNAIHLNPLQFCPSMPLLGFPVFCLSSSKVLNRYFHILVTSMTIWSVLKLPKIEWPSPLIKPRSVTTRPILYSTSANETLPRLTKYICGFRKCHIVCSNICEVSFVTTFNTNFCRDPVSLLRDQGQLNTLICVELCYYSM